jgi:hypothetical protein
MDAAIGGVLTFSLAAMPDARRKADYCVAGVDGVRLCLHQSAVVTLRARESSPIRVRWARISAWAALSASSGVERCHGVVRGAFRSDVGSVVEAMTFFERRDGGKPAEVGAGRNTAGSGASSPSATDSGQRPHLRR